MNKIEVQLFTDGSCYPNPSKHGSWAYIIKYSDGKTVKKSGVSTEETTTNNRMELMAVIQGLKSIDCSGRTVELVTDSEYVGKGIMFWMNRWSKCGWKVKNSDLWKDLYKLVNLHNVYVTCVKGHSGHIENEECDRMAAEARKGV